MPETFHDQLSRVELLANDPAEYLSGDDMAALQAVLADRERLRIACQSFASDLLSVRKENTDVWMEYAAVAFNELCEALGDSDRFKYDGRDMLRRVTP